MQITLEMLPQEALALSCDDTLRCACPVCGATAFTVTRTSQQRLSFICFRASCGVKGHLYLSGVPSEVKRPRPPKLFTDAVLPLTSRELSRLAHKFSLPPDSLAGVGWSDGRVMYPCYNLAGALAGYVGRHYPELAKGHSAAPYGKARWCPVLPQPPGLVCTSPPCSGRLVAGRRVVLVEDWVSAHRLWVAGICAAPLVGATLNSRVVDALLLYSVTHITLILDADAIVPAVKLLHRYRPLFAVFNLHPLTGPDIKDMSESAFNKLVGEL